MGIIIRQSIRSSIISYFGVAIGYVNVLWLYPYFLSTEQVGLFRLIQSTAYLLATFGQMGLAQSFIKFYPEFKHKKGYLAAALVGGTMGFLLLCGFTGVFQRQIVNYFSRESPLFVEYFQVTLIVSYLITLFQLLEAYSRSLLKIVFPTLMKDIGLRVLTMAFLLCYGFGYLRFNQLVSLFIAIYGTVLVGLLIHFARNRELHFSLDFGFLKQGRLKRIVHYGLFSLIGAGGTQIILQIDSVMISGSLGLEETGIYTIAFFIGIVIEMPKRAIAQLSSALLAQSFNKHDMAAVKKLYQQTSINQLLIGSLLLIGIWANLSNIYAFIPNNEAYLTGVNVVLFIGLGKLSDMAFGTNGEIIVMSKYFRFNVVAVAVLAVLTILLNLWLIPLFGIEGAAVASFLAMLTFNLTKYIFVWYKFGIQPFNSKTLVLLAIAAGALILNSLVVPFNNPLLDLVLRSAMIAFFVLGLAYWLKVSDEFNNLIHQVLEKSNLR
ncbi:oligosaccharide flippase family protein [Roseivirga thermotolerans]|uniref:oligosaccharide flippase family protein n=1 Tax=Roseivirga thermotolerans TaxID=1758176 RepID=UPI00273FC389|nr:polysaccharide biosynthesis C-terminal domain-containing protein [Roseivirga thermotolerans]